MTVPLSTAENQFLSNGTTTVYQTTIFAKDASHIKVRVNELETLAFSASQFNSAAGVKITFNTAPVNGGAIRVTRTLPLLQPTSIQNNSGYLAQTTENLADDAMMIAQQLAAQITNPAAAIIAAATALEFSRVSSIAALTALPKASLTNGVTYRVDGYVGGYIQGGGLFTWSSASTTAANLVTIFSTNEAGTGRWLRQFENSLTPWDAGAVSGQIVDQTFAFIRLMSVFNAIGSTINALDFAGNWRCNGGVIQLNQNKQVILTSGFSKLTRLSNGVMALINGNDCRVEKLTIEAGVYTGTIISDNALRNTIEFNTLNDGGGAAIDATKNSVNSKIQFNMIRGPEGTGIGAGGAVSPLVLGNSVYGTLAVYARVGTPEGIQGDELDGAIIALNYVEGCGGVGNIAGNDSVNSIIALNLSRNGKHGIGFGQKGHEGTQNLIMSLNMLLNSEGYGIRGRDYYRKSKITGITRGVAPVITFERIAITGISTGAACIVTAPAHGFITGDKITIHNVTGINLGADTKINNLEFRLRYLTANTVALLGLEDDNPYDTSAFTAYVSGGFFDHAYKADRGLIRFDAVLGMTQINYATAPAFRIKSVTNNTVTIWNKDETDFDNSSYSAYTSGGFGEVGDGLSKTTIMGNVAQGNALGAISVGNRYDTKGTSQNIIIGNAADADKSHFGRQITSQIGNRKIYFKSVQAADALTVTGNGTAYTASPNQIDDVNSCYNAITGVFIAPQAGFYEFQFAADMGASGGATGAIARVRVADPWGAVENFDAYMVPAGGNPASAVWAGRSRAGVYLEKGTAVTGVAIVSGLGLVSSLKAGSYFSGYLVG